MPSKNIVDFANQIKGYLQKNELVSTKNKCPVTFTSETKNGVQFTNNGDGTVTINGTASANSTIWLTGTNNDTFHLEADKYVINMGVDPSYFDNNFSVQCYRKDGSNDYGNPTIFAYPDSLTTNDLIDGDYHVRIYVSSGKQIDNLVIKPMICTLTEWEKSHTYEPYYVPVKDRFEPVDITSEIEVNTTQTAYEVTSVSLHAYRFGKLINVYFQIKSLTENAMPSGRPWITLFSNLPTPISEVVQNVNPSSAGNICQVYAPSHISLPRFNIQARGGTTDALYTVNLFYFAKE